MPIRHYLRARHIVASLVTNATAVQIRVEECKGRSDQASIPDLRPKEVSVPKTLHTPNK